MRVNTVFVVVVLNLAMKTSCSSTLLRCHRQLASAEIDEKNLTAAESTTTEPKKLPRLSRAQKFAIIHRRLTDDPASASPDAIAELESKEWALVSKDRKNSKKKRRETNSEKLWRRMPIGRQPHSLRPKLTAMSPGQCPQRFDAVTQAANTRTYVFAGDLVYEVYRRDGLQQKSAFLIRDVFPEAPRPVIATLTNRRSGITILVGTYDTHRYVWNRRVKQFQQTEKFVCFDAYWNTVLHTGLLRDYMPKLPRDAIGVAYAERNAAHGRQTAQSTYTMALITANRELQLYDTRKWTIAQTYPLAVGEFLACLTAKETLPK